MKWRFWIPCIRSASGPSEGSVLYFFTPPDERGQSEIHYCDFATGKVRKIQTIAARIRCSLALSPDGRTLLYSQVDDAGSDLMHVENFR
jgi:Tol biopolymer transport system component